MKLHEYIPEYYLLVHVFTRKLFDFIIYIFLCIFQYISKYFFSPKNDNKSSKYVNERYTVNNYQIIRSRIYPPLNRIV